LLEQGGEVDGRVHHDPVVFAMGSGDEAVQAHGDLVAQPPAHGSDLRFVRRARVTHLNDRSRSDDVTTETLESAIASDASIGWSAPCQPSTGPIQPPGRSNGTSTPAATGIKITL